MKVRKFNYKKELNMTVKRLALNSDGKLTYCTSSEENMGKGRCNHIIHQNSDESAIHFISRTGNLSIKKWEHKIDLKYEGNRLELTKKFMALHDEFEEYRKNSKSNKIAGSLMKDSYESDINNLNISRLSEDKTDIKINSFLQKFKSVVDNGNLDDPDDIKDVNEAINNIMAYGQSLIMYGSNLDYVRQEYSGEDLRQATMEIDRKRRSMHNNAMVGLSLLNGLSNLYGFDKVYDKEISDSNRSTITDDIISMIQSSI